MPAAMPVRRSYVYRIRTDPRRDPLRARFVLHHPRRLDREAWRPAPRRSAGGTTSVRSRPPRPSTSSSSARCCGGVARDRRQARVPITADAFLRHMVRVLVGTMLDAPIPTASRAARGPPPRRGRPHRAATWADAGQRRVRPAGVDLSAPPPAGSFSYEPAFVAAAAVTAVAYARGAHGRVVPAWRMLLFGLGLALVVFSLNSPLETLAAHYLVLAHLLQNALIADWAPPLLILGLTPEDAARAGAPRWAADGRRYPPAGRTRDLADRVIPGPRRTQSTRASCATRRC